MTTERVYRDARPAGQTADRMLSDAHLIEAHPAASNAATGDEQAVRDLFRQLLNAWGRGDGAAYGALFTEDAAYVAFDGSNRRGTDAIATEHQQLFDTWLKGTRLVGQIESLRFLGPDVALLVTTGGTIFPGQRDTRGRRPSIQTLVAVKHDGAWRFATFHNTRIVKRNAVQWMLYGLTSWIVDR